MIKPIEAGFVPAMISPPGESIREELEARGLSQREFARRMGLAPKTVNFLLSGKSALTPEMAMNLEKVLEVPARFWLNLDATYQAHMAREAGVQEWKKQIEWARRFPIKEAHGLGWIETKEHNENGVIALLKFFNVASSKEWEDVYGHPEVCFRHSPTLKSNRHALWLWLRQGQRMAENRKLTAYSAQAFEAALEQIRRAVTQPIGKAQRVMLKEAESAGVHLIFLPGLPKVPVTGACFWKNDTPVIMLSLRHKWEDIFWFTFFHEAKHVLQGIKKRLFVDEPSDGHQDPKELEANHYAANLLIPQKELQAFAQARRFDISAIHDFAQSHQVTPGIVVGQLQHHGVIPWPSPLNRLRARFDGSLVIGRHRL